MNARAWSISSQRVHDELDPVLQLIVTEIRDTVCDISLICGFRNRLVQNKAFSDGTSKLRWPNGKHNKLPSKAVDLCPYPFPEGDLKVWASLGYIAGRAMSIAEKYGVSLRWGGDWDMDGDLTDQDFDDLFHLEIVEES